VKPGGVLFVSDFFCDSRIVRFYMDHVFSLTSSIDDDETEIWVRQERLLKATKTSLTLKQFQRFTLLPNFLPRWAMWPSINLEGAVERATGNRWGAHFMATFEKRT